MHKPHRHIKSFLPILLFTLTFIPLLHAARSRAADRAHVTILGSTDLHGNILGIDYYTNRPDNRGLAKIGTIVKHIRNENPTALLIDSGDTIQGTPLEYYHNKKHNEPPDPMMLAMNYLHFDAMTVGNHEYNFG
jgi:2',3'-cyclic-nucleotide 2'-phosphodiesterase / 3'-nucleotidase